MGPRRRWAARDYPELALGAGRRLERGESTIGRFVDCHDDDRLGKLDGDTHGIVWRVYYVRLARPRDSHDGPTASCARENVGDGRFDAVGPCGPSTVLE